MKNKFDFNKYSRVNYNSFQTLTWKNSPPKIELEAQLEYKLIDKNELISYFKTIIDKCILEVSDKSFEYYESRMLSFKRTSINNDIYQYKLLKFKNRINDEVISDTSVFKRAQNELKAEGKTKINNKQIAEKSIEIIDKFDFAYYRLNEISQYQSRVQNSMLYNNLSNRYIKEIIDYLPDLFKTKNNFNKVIELLIEDKRIEKNDTGYKWVDITNDTPFTTLKLLIILGVVLEYKNYFRIKPTNKLMVELLSSYFNFDISERYYGKIKKEITTDIKKYSSINNSIYFKPYYYIPTLKLNLL